MAIVMGTAGHIDHGKTTLIHALTGIQCDRLEEEKRRGITIELGFAYFDLPDKNGQTIRMSIIDVPGHEKFIKNMVAGAQGIDFVLLVIAADEGVMPQTREHIEICSLLNIQDGIIALTKIDAVDQEMIELAQKDIEELTKGTFLEHAPVFPVSSLTGEGLEALKDAIREKNYSLHPKRKNDLLRLPVDRIFSLKGHGTLITGTLLSGTASLGDEVCIMPKNIPTKIRSIQNHGQAVEKALAGHRTSINLAGINVSDIEKGDILTTPQTLFPSTRWLVKLHCLSSAPRAIKHKTEIHLHHGTKEVMAKLYLKEKEKLEPAQTCLCEIRFSEPMCGVFGDKCIIRSFSPLQTIAGAVIINPLPHFPRLKEILHDIFITLEQDFQNMQKCSTALYEQLKSGKEKGLALKQLALLCPLEAKNLEKTLQQLLTQKRCILYDKENKIYLADCYAQKYEQAMIQKVQEYHKNEPLKQYMPKASLLAQFEPAKLAQHILGALVKQGKLIYSEDGICTAEHTVSLNSQENTLKANIYALFLENSHNPPLLKELLEKFNCSPKDILNVLALLIQEQKLVKIMEGMYFLQSELSQIKENMLLFFQKNENLSPSDFKVLSQGLTRKYAIPVLEYFDKERMTIRVGDVRKLRQTSAGK